MACGACGKKRGSNVNVNVKSPEDYNITGGLDVRTLNDRQLRARLEVFKRKFCSDCTIRYECTYVIYLDCKGLKKRQ